MLAKCDAKNKSILLMNMLDISTVDININDYRMGGIM